MHEVHCLRFKHKNDVISEVIFAISKLLFNIKCDILFNF